MQRVYECTPSPADPKAPQSQALRKLGVGGAYEIPNVAENKARSGFGLERIKIREKTRRKIYEPITEPGTQPGALYSL